MHTLSGPFEHQTYHLLFQSSNSVVFFRACFCQIFYSQCNVEEVYQVAHADNPVILQNYSHCILSSLGSSINGMFLLIDLETVLNLQPVWLQARHISRHSLGCHSMSVASYSSFIFCLISLLRQWEGLLAEFSSAPLCLKEGWTTKTTPDKNLSN